MADAEPAVEKVTSTIAEEDKQESELSAKPTEATTDTHDTEKSLSPAKEVDSDADVAKTETENETAGVGDAEQNGELSKLERSIIRQVEYYFGDANMNRDKFLLGEIAKDAEGWVPFTVLLTFKRLVALSSDAEVIVNALLKSDEGLLEISEDRQKVRRHPERPLPEQNDERRKEIMSRTAYAKGFYVDTPMDELLEFFAPYEKVVNINMRKYLDKADKKYKFKGSVFVTFEKKEQAQEFIEKDKVVFKDRELLRKWQDKYIEDKRAELQGRIKKQKEQKQKNQQEAAKFELPKGTVLLFEGANEDVTRETLREALEKIEGEWEIAYIDYRKGDKEGHVRLSDEGSAAQLLEKLDEQKLKLKDDIDLKVRLLTEEEEKTFLEKAVEDMKNRRKQSAQRHKGGFGHHKRRGQNNGHHNAKKAKVE